MPPRLRRRLERRRRRALHQQFGDAEALRRAAEFLDRIALRLVEESEPELQADAVLNLAGQATAACGAGPAPLL